MNRKLDDYARLVVPIEMRKQLDLKIGDEVNIECVGNKIILTNPKKEDRIEKAIKYIEKNMVYDVDICDCWVTTNELLSILENDN